MSAYGGQFCTSLLAPFAVLYVGFSLSRDILHFPEVFSLKMNTKRLFKEQKRVQEFHIRLGYTELQAIYVHGNKLPLTRNLTKRPRKITLGNY